MITVLLGIIYAAFVSLGLPDSLLGSGWPVIHQDLNVPLSSAGIITMIVSFGTVVSALSSDRLTSKYGPGKVTAVSVLMTAAALFGYSISRSIAVMCLWAIPYGLGAGAVDAALNNYVAVHYKSRHMSWLHCMWGVGATLSPVIMNACLQHDLGWRSGYRTVGIIQIVLTAILFATLPLWKKAGGTAAEAQTEERKHTGLLQAIRIPGVPLVLLSFLGYCGMESTVMLWASSYLVQARGVDVVTAAGFGALYVLGITIGRFLSGFVSDKLGDVKMIRIGCLAVFGGLLLVLNPFASGTPALLGLILAGVGSAPIYPSIIHATPERFGADKSQSIVGMQMASAYIGSTFMPPLFGLISNISMGFFPFFLLVLAALMFITSEALNRLTSLSAHDASILIR